MTMSEEFSAAYADAEVVQGAARPELLPVRLARACQRVLPVAGVGISMFGTDEIRIPIGASDDDAAVAERLQFTAAEGPCLDAHALARSVLATETFIAQRWPDFYTGLVARTPFRAIAAIPWPATLKGAGTVDLLFHRSRDLADLDFSRGRRGDRTGRTHPEHRQCHRLLRTGSGTGLARRADGEFPERGVHRHGHAQRRAGVSTHQTRWRCFAGTRTPLAAPSTRSPMTSRAGGSPPRTSGWDPTSSYSRTALRTGCPAWWA